jgi:hypothetical protein
MCIIFSIDVPSINNARRGKENLLRETQRPVELVVICSVADPHHSDADPDPARHFDADPDPIFYFEAVRIRSLASK